MAYQATNTEKLIAQWLDIKPEEVSSFVLMHRCKPLHVSQLLKLLAWPVDGVYTDCVKCGQTFRLVYDEYPTPTTLEICYCESGGVYAVSVKCPHCKHEESIK